MSEPNVFRFSANLAPSPHGLDSKLLIGRLLQQLSGSRPIVSAVNGTEVLASFDVDGPKGSTASMLLGEAIGKFMLAASYAGYEQPSILKITAISESHIGVDAALDEASLNNVLLAAELYTIDLTDEYLYRQIAE